MSWQRCVTKDEPRSQYTTELVLVSDPHASRRQLFLVPRVSCCSILSPHPYHVKGADWTHQQEPGTHLSVISVCLHQDTLKTGFNKMNVIIVLQIQNEKNGVVMGENSKCVHVLGGH